LRKSLRWANFGIVAAAAMALTFAAPAEAAQSIVKYKNGNCMAVDENTTAYDQAIDMASCTGSKSNWRVKIIDEDWNGHPIARFQNVATGMCMDTLAHVTDEAVFTHACNEGHYQWFEVFTNSNGTRTFKSYAAYYDQGHLNLCIQDRGNNLVAKLETCTSAANQQFTRVAVS